MNTYTYHKEIRVLLAQILNALGDLVIKRLDEENDENSTDTIKVSLQYAPKQRVIYDIVNKNQHIQLPAMAITMSSIQYDKDRAFNKIAGFNVSQNYLSGGGQFPEPLPVKLNLNFSILSRYQRDLDQIITCIFSNFYPYIVISYRHPDLGHEVRCVVMWNGDINLNYPIDAQANTPFRIVADSSFTVLGWIYKNASNPYGIIHNIDTTFTSVSDIFDNYYTMKALEFPETTDYFVISGRPQCKDIDPYTTSIGVTSLTYDLVGDMFQFVDSIVVSGTPQGIFPVSSYELLNPFVDSKRLSSIYQPFSAVPLLTSNWSVVNDYHIRLNIPMTYTTGYVDVLAISPFGVGRLTLDTVRPTFNPYVSGTIEYNNYQTIQKPTVSGIQIR
jgi:hypothetical protein